MAATVNLKIKIRLHGYTPIRFAKAKLALTEIFPKILADSKTPNSRGVDNVSSLSGTRQSSRGKAENIFARLVHSAVPADHGEREVPGVADVDDR